MAACAGTRPRGGRGDAVAGLAGELARAAHQRARSRPGADRWLLAGDGLARIRPAETARLAGAPGPCGDVSRPSCPGWPGARGWGAVAAERTARRAGERRDPRGGLEAGARDRGGPGAARTRRRPRRPSRPGHVPPLDGSPRAADGGGALDRATTRDALELLYQRRPAGPGNRPAAPSAAGARRAACRRSSSSASGPGEDSARAAGRGASGPRRGAAPRSASWRRWGCSRGCPAALRRPRCRPGGHPGSAEGAQAGSRGVRTRTELPTATQARAHFRPTLRER